MDIHEAIHTRRTIKRFTDRAIGRAEVERLFEAAVSAPNHRMTQPWRFYVLGPEARRAYGAVLGDRKAKKAPDAASARLVADQTIAKHVALPAMVAVTMTLAEHPETLEEDYAATMMAVQNIMLEAHGMGLGTHLRTGGIMADPRARTALGIPDGERIVATIEVGEPAEVPVPKPRKSAAELTKWLG